MKQLVDEYASNLNLLLIKMGKGDIDHYTNRFSLMFQKFFYATDEKSIYEIWQQHKDNIDLIIISVDNNIEINNLEQKLELFKKYNILLPVCVIYADIEIVSTYKILNSCHFDSSIPYPYDEEKINKFFYRTLRRILDIKELYLIIENLENSIDYEIKDNTETNVFKIESILESLNSLPVMVDSSREKDLRFTQTDKISADEFINTLDLTFIDKVEVVQEYLDDFITVLYDFEEKNGSDAYLLLPSIVEGIQEVYILIDSIGSFSIVARAFDSLKNFLVNLNEENLEQFEQKQMLAKMLISISLDIENWIKVVFIEHTTDDIHYFDASFSSNILEIENVFAVEEACEDDFEFF